MRRTEQPNVTTWADAFGVWHARVTYDRNPMGAAQVAIWREIEARQGRPAPIPHVVEVEPGHWVEDVPPVDKPRLSALMAGGGEWSK